MSALLTGFSGFGFAEPEDAEHGDVCPFSLVPRRFPLAENGDAYDFQSVPLRFREAELRGPVTPGWGVFMGPRVLATSARMT